MLWKPPTANNSTKQRNTENIKSNNEQTNIPQETKLKHHSGRILIDKEKGRILLKVKRSFNISSDFTWKGLRYYYPGEE